MAYLIYQFEEDQKEAIPISNEKGFCIGRNPDNDITILEDHSTSRRHCLIKRPDNQSPFMLEDLGSSNGTFVNGFRISGEEIALRDGDILIVGHAEFIFHVDKEDYELTTTTSIIVRHDALGTDTDAIKASNKAQKDVAPEMVDTITLQMKIPPGAMMEPEPVVPEPEPFSIFPAGTDIEGYEIIKPIGIGNYSTVYLANQSTLQRTVALKVFQMANLDDKMKESFFINVQNAGRIQHPNLVKYLDTGIINNLCYLSMTYLPEKNLADKLKELGKVPEAKVLDWLTQIVGALNHAYSHLQVLHLNLTPNNIIFNDSDEPVIVDLGLSQWLSTYCQVNRKCYFGSSTYMSPEQTLDKKVSFSSDMYSLGIILYEMLVGNPPFEAESAYRLIEKHMKKNIRLPKNLKLSEKCRKILVKMTEKTADTRYPSWEALLKNLQHQKKPAATSTKSQAMPRSQITLQKLRKPSKNLKLVGKAPKMSLKKILRKKK